MISCYVFTFLSIAMLITTGFQGYFHFNIFHANHATFALLTTIIYLFTETLVIFFFVGTGVSIRDYTQEHHLDQKFRKRSLEIKRRVYPPMLLNMLLVMILFISGGAVDTGRFPGWLHGVLFFACLGHFLFAVKIQHRSFREDTAIILEMSGIRPNF